MPPSPDHAPIATARSSLWNDAAMIARLPGVSSAPPIALQAAGGDQRVDVGRQAAEQRGEREPHDADEEDPAPAEPVTQGAAEQDQGGEGQRVGVDRPLQALEPGVEVLADPAERDVDDGRVEHRQAGAQHRGQEHPATARTAHSQGSVGGRRPGRHSTTTSIRWNSLRSV